MYKFDGWCDLLNGCLICLSLGDRQMPLVSVVVPVCVLHISESSFSSIIGTEMRIKAQNCSL